MSELGIEVYRDDVDDLTKKLMVLVQENTGSIPYIDRAVIVAAALANVACHVDAVEPKYTAECTSRLKNIASSWTMTNSA
jgi:hypothetical protein